MSYDFTTIVDRTGTGSEKWNAMKKLCPDVPAGTVPFSVADMEFLPPPQLVKGLQDYLGEAVYGYTCATDSYYDAIIRWMERRHAFTVQKEWIVQTAGVVPALNQMVEAFTEPEDSVLILTPVYHPFYSAVAGNGRGLVESPLVINGDTYDIDFADLEQKASRPEVKLMIFCSPHNPIGRVWSAEETERVCRICMENEVFLIADEIHSDLIMPGVIHTSAGVFKEYLSNCAICTAPSKTFNLAGFQASNIIIPNEAYRRKMPGSGGYFSLNFLSYKACEIVYNQCEDWLEELLEVIDGNRKTVEEFMKEQLPGVKVYRMQGTYLQWLDFSCLGLDTKELEVFMTRKAHLFLDEGYLFGEAGAGYERWNLACPRETLREGLYRLAAAVRTEGF